MGLIETLHLSWDEYEPNIKKGFSELRNDGDFYDVTIACGDNHIKAHKVILAASSIFFRTLLKAVPHQHPLLYLKGIDFHHMKSILTFMYNGEAQVKPEELDNFLNAARELKVNGLMRHQAGAAPAEEENKKPQPSSTAKNSFKRKRPIDNSVVLYEKKLNKDDTPHDQLDNSEVNNRASSRLKDRKPEVEGAILDESCYSEYEEDNDPLSISVAEEIDVMDFNAKNLSQAKWNELNEWLDARVAEFVSLRDENKMYKCLKCSYSSNHRGSVMKHVEARHFVTNGFSCDICHSKYKTRHTLSGHKRNVHKGTEEETPEIKDLTQI